MIWHGFGDRSNSVILLIHGVLTPWTIWQEVIDHYSRNYHVIVPELDAHTLNEPSSYTSVEDEADKICRYVNMLNGGRIHMICGLSMGGRIAAAVAGTPGITVDRLVLDGAPLLKLPKMLRNFMTNNYIKLIARSRRREPKVIESFKRDFLPAKHLDDYLKIADNMDEESVRNMISSVFGGEMIKRYDDGLKILFMHGTRGNESVSRKAAVRLKTANPQTGIRCFDGYGHAELLCREPAKWIEEVDRWAGADQ